MNPLSKTFTRLLKRLSGPDGRRTLYIYSPDALSPNPERHPSWKRAEDAVQAVESGNKIFVQGCAATPNFLLGKLAEYGLKERLKDIELIHIPTVGPAVYNEPEYEGTSKPGLVWERVKDIELIHIPTVGPAVYNEPEYEGVFRSRSLFIGANCREAIACGRADTVPIFLSEIPLLFRRNIYQLDVAIIHVSPPDQHGFCSLGISVDCTRAAVQNAKYIIAQVNQHMPRTLGDGLIHSSNIDCMVHHNEPLPEITPVSRSPEVNEIGRLIAENLVEDGATLQTGIGNLPDTVLHKLHNHKDLGFHSEMIGDTVVSLVEKGAMTNARKSIQTGKIVSSFAMGTKKLYSFLNDNSFVSMQECDFTNNISVISQNPRVTAINTCLEVDITGQVCSDSLGTYMYSGFGGQIDFIRGAASSLDGEGKPIIACTSTTEKGTSRIVPTLKEGFGGQMDFIRGAACSVDGEGKPIIACTSTTENGTSRIVPTLKEGAGVVTTRAHVHYIVTEFGIAYLFGKNLRQRAFELIKVAHPSERELLEKAAFERFKCMPSP